MLDLHNILWAVPGIVFIYTYNKKKPLANIGTSGWSYIFAILCVSCLVWLPFYAIFESCGYFKSDDIQKSENMMANMSPWGLWFLSIGTALIGHLLARLLIAFSWTKGLFPKLNDTFFINCVKWEKQPVIVNLKSAKVYVGILSKYPENLNDRLDAQAISILPLYSGIRNPHTGKVIWHIRFSTEEAQNSEVTIARNEMLTFAKFQPRVFARLNPQFDEASTR